LPVKNVKVIGSLEFSQKNAIEDVSGARKLAKTLYEGQSFDSLAKVEAKTLLRNYFNLNMTTEFRHQTPIVQYGESDTVQVNMLLKVPQKQEFVYVSPFWQVIKFAWVQYCFVFIFWYIVLYEGLFGFLVKKFVFESVEVLTLNTENMEMQEK
jgi:hypothetical protein